MSFRSRGRRFSAHNSMLLLNMWSCTYLHLFPPAPSCNMVIILILFNSHHGEWANSSQTGSQRAPPRRWGWKTLSITVFSILFFSAIFALRSWWASVPDGRPWIRGSLWPHFSLRTNELAPPPKFSTRLTEQTKRLLSEQQRSAIQTGQSPTSPKSMLHFHIRKACSNCHSTHQDTYSTTTSPPVPSHETYFSWLTEAPSPPYNSLEDYFRDRLRQIARGARKAAGLPATSDVGELATLIVALRSSIESNLGGQTIPGAAVTILLLAALYQDDLGRCLRVCRPYLHPALPLLVRRPLSRNGRRLRRERARALLQLHWSCWLRSRKKESTASTDERKRPLGVVYTELLTSRWASEGMWFSYPAPEGPVVADLNLGWDKRNDNSKWRVLLGGGQGCHHYSCAGSE